jgi:transcription elongation factor Elf1
MSILRARSACPRCNSEDEVWFCNGKITPISLTQCSSCLLVYDSSSYVVSILELRTNLTASVTQVIHS